jgi:hypothetical protein
MQRTSGMGSSMLLSRREGEKGRGCLPVPPEGRESRDTRTCLPVQSPDLMTSNGEPTDIVLCADGTSYNPITNGTRRSEPLEAAVCLWKGAQGHG